MFFWVQGHHLADYELRQADVEDGVEVRIQHENMFL